MKSYCVYVHKKKSDGSIFYVGKSRGHRRANSKAGRSEYWSRVERKHGRTVSIVCDNISNESACELESFLISQIGRENLANLTDGGEGTPGRVVSKKTRALVSMKNKGKPPARHAIKKALEKTRKPVGTVCGMVFNSISAASRFVMPEKPKTAKLNISSCCNGVSGQKMAYGLEFRFLLPCGSLDNSNHTEKPSRFRKVYCSNGMVFDNAIRASEWLRLNGQPRATNSQILANANGRVKSAYGYTWAFSKSAVTEYVKPSARTASKTRMRVLVDGVILESQVAAAEYISRLTGEVVHQSSIGCAIRSKSGMYKGFSVVRAQ